MPNDAAPKVDTVSDASRRIARIGGPDAALQAAAAKVAAELTEGMECPEVTIMLAFMRGYEACLRDQLAAAKAALAESNRL